MTPQKHTESDLQKYLITLFEVTGDGRFIEKSVEQDIFSKIKKACGIINCNTSDLLSGLDFKPNDLRTEALESFLAELRAIFWLRDFGFINIKPVQGNKQKSPDFIAERNNKSYAIEVFCLTQKFEQKRDEKLNIFVGFNAKFVADFISKEGKKSN